MRVSVIITTKNEEKNIGPCLTSIKKQTHPQKDIEIIVVDNHSTDATVKIARQYTSHIYIKGPERSAQRNFGIAKSRGTYVLYLDADMTLSPKVIEAALSQCTTRHIDALYIPEIVTGTTFWTQVRQFERGFYDGTVIDCVRFIKRSAFDTVGGFDETMSGPEDWDFDKKIRQRFRTGILTQPLYHNEGAFNMTRYLNKKGYYAQSFHTYIAKWGGSDPDIKKQFGLWYRYIGVFIENGKWKRLVQQPVLSVSMLMLRFFVGVVYLRTKITKNRVQ